MKNKTAKDYKREFYKYADSIGISINDIQRLRAIMKEEFAASQFKPVEVSIGNTGEVKTAEGKFSHFYNEKGDYTIAYDVNGENETIIGFNKSMYAAVAMCDILNHILQSLQPVKDNVQVSIPSEKIKEIILNHCAGATDKIADGVLYNELSEAIFNRLSSQPQEDKWVSVNSQIPAHKQLVYAVTKSGMPMPSIFYDNGSFYGFYPFTNFYLNENSLDNYYSDVDLDLSLDDVIMWAPLPSPPKVASIKEKGENG